MISECVGDHSSTVNGGNGRLVHARLFSEDAEYSFLRCLQKTRGDRVMAKIDRRIYECFLAECPPATLPDEWQFVDVHQDAHRLPANPQCAIARLREQFSDDELLGSRVTVRRGEELVLHPKLITRDRYVIIVRDQFGGQCSLLTSAGDLHGSVPLFALGQDETVRYALGASLV